MILFILFILLYFYINKEMKHLKELNPLIYLKEYQEEKKQWRRVNY